MQSLGRRGVLVLVAAAGLVAGCGGGRASSPGSTVASTTSPASQPGAPAWETALGAGVTVTPPGSNPPSGSSSPGGVVRAEFAAYQSSHLSVMCTYIEPSAQSKCARAVAGVSSSGATYRNFSLGYIAVKGTRSLVGTLGTDCEPQASPTCVTNSDPAAGFSSAESFDTLYNQALASAASPAHEYALITCVEVGGRWYVYLPPGSF